MAPRTRRACWLDGHWAFPVANANDFDAAVKSVGRTPGKNRVKVRRYLLQLAKKYGYKAPPSWNSDGTTKSGVRGWSAVEAEARDLIGYQSPERRRWARSYRGPTTRDRHEATRIRVLYSATAGPTEREYAKAELERRSWEMRREARRLR